MTEKAIHASHLRSTIGAVLILVFFYPMTVAGIGTFSNGGFLGLSSLVIASWLAWRSFALNTTFTGLRRFVQLPVTAFITFMAFWDGFCQYMSGNWLGI
jgi:hypothetical protein